MNDGAWLHRAGRLSTKNKSIFPLGIYDFEIEYFDYQRLNVDVEAKKFNPIKNICVPVLQDFLPHTTLNELTSIWEYQFHIFAVSTINNLVLHYYLLLTGAINSVGINIGII